MATNIGTLALKFVGDTTGLESSFKKISQIAVGTAAGLGLFKIGGAFISGLEKMAGLLKESAVHVFKMGSDMERAQTAFQTLVGSTRLGTELFQQVQQLATETPFKADELMQGAKLLLGYGVPAKDLLVIMRQIGDVASGTGAHFHNIALAYGQVLSKGKLTAEELNRQLGNAGVGAETIAQGMGISTGKLIEMMEKGQVSAQMFQKAFAAITAEGGRFNAAMSRDLQTVGGRWAQLVETIQLAAGRVGMAIFERFPIGKFLERLSNSMSGLNIEKLISAMERIWQIVQPIGKAFVELGLTIAYAGQQLIENFEPSAKSIGDALGQGAKNFGILFIKVVRYVVEYSITAFSALADVIGSLTKNIALPAMWAVGLLDRKEVNAASGAITDFQKFVTKSRYALVNLDINKAASDASGALDGFMGGVSGRGGVSPVSAKQEAAMRALEQAKERDRIWLRAMEDAMPGFKVGVEKIMSSVADPKSMLSPFGAFFQDQKMLQMARGNAAMFGGNDAINRALLKSWQTATGGMNNLPLPITQAIRGNTQEASRAINEARAAMQGQVGSEAQIRQMWDRMLKEEQRANEINQKTLDVLLKIQEEKTLGVSVGAGR